MKSFICAIVIFAFIIAGSVWYSSALTNSIDHIEKRVYEVESCINNENWQNCKEKTEALLDDWTKTQKWLKAIVNHREIDQIHETLYELKGYVQVKNKDEALVKADVLRMFFRRIPENEALSLINIL